MGILVLFFTLSIVFSFLCSIWEAVLLSITPSYITRMQQENPALGERLKYFKDDIDKPLSAILTLNTIAHTVGAIGVGAQAGVVFGENYFSIFGFQLSYESVIATLMTLAILILSEIIPKTLGANNWRTLSGITVKSLNVIMFILTPFIWLSMLITKSLKSSHVGSVLSRADYLAMTSLGEESGALRKEETQIIRNLLDLNKVVVKEIMTPRAVVFMLNEKVTMQDYYQSKKGFQFSRIPIFHENRDQVVGFVLKDDILHAILEQKSTESLTTIKRDISYVDENLNLNDFFKKMADENHQIAAVTDPYGSLQGLVTLEDVMETILGYEIVDETDDIADLQAYARKKWEDRAKKMGMEGFE